MQWVVRQWLAQQLTLLFASGINKLVEKWDKCLNVLREYMLKNESTMRKEFTSEALNR